MRLRSVFAPLAVGLGLILAGLAPAQTVDSHPEIKKEVLEKVSKLIQSNAFVPGIDFAKWPEFLTAEQPKLDAAKDDSEFQSAINEALRKFGASHCVVTTPRMNETRRTSSSVGIGISGQVVEGGLMVVRVVAGGAADIAGLVPGDTIIEVNGAKVEGTRGIPGPEGSKVSIKVKHGDGKIDTYNLTRKPFSTIQPEEIAYVDDRTAKISIHTFDFTYDPDRVESLFEKAASRPNLIIDLRDNGGGAVVNLQHFLGLLLPEDTPIGTFISRRNVDRFVEETKGSPTDLPAIAANTKNKLKPLTNKHVLRYIGKVVVLINGNSGSASEMCAAALRETIGATIVGKKSAGAVLVSVIVPVSNGFMLQYPLSDYVTTTGKRLEGNGVVPDYAVEEPRIRLPQLKDLAVAKAVEVLDHLAEVNGTRTDGRAAGK
jgi:carboxyl-terminal processing protease